MATRIAIKAISGKLSQSRCHGHQDDGMVLNSRAQCTEIQCGEKATHRNRKLFHHCISPAGDTDRRASRDRSDVCGVCGRRGLLSDSGHCEPCDPTTTGTRVERIVLQFQAAAGWHATQRNLQVNGGIVSAHRPDAVFRLQDRFIVLEVDENQHCRRDWLEEVQRMATIRQNFTDPVVFIRFNPDVTRLNRQPLEHRIQELIAALNAVKWAPKRTGRLYAIYLFYDRFDNGTVLQLTQYFEM